jgi:Alfin
MFMRTSRSVVEESFERLQQSELFILHEVFPDLSTAVLTLVVWRSVEEFYQQCDPERDNLCLYGTPSGGWIVDLPAEEVPPELPGERRRDESLLKHAVPCRVYLFNVTDVNIWGACRACAWDKFCPKWHASTCPLSAAGR